MTREAFIRKWLGTPLKTNTAQFMQFMDAMRDDLDKVIGHKEEITLPLSELELFFYEMGEDWHLWDEAEKGQYPIQRTFDAMKKFIEKKKNEG